MDTPEQHRRGGDRDGGRAVSKDRKELAHRRLDEDKAGYIGQTAAHPVSNRRSEAGIFPEPGFGIGINAQIQFWLASGQRLKYEGQEQHSDARDAPGDQATQHSGGAAE